MSEQLEIRPLKQVPRITVSIDEKIQVKQYEPKTAFISISSDLPADFDIFNDDIEEYTRKAFAKIEVELQKQIRKFKGENLPDPITEMTAKPAKQKNFTKRFGV